MRRRRIVLGALLLCLLVLGTFRAQFDSRFGDRATIAAAGDLAIAPAHEDELAKRRTAPLHALTIGGKRWIADHLDARSHLLHPDLSAEVSADRRPRRHIPRMKAGDPPSA